MTALQVKQIFISLFVIFTLPVSYAATHHSAEFVESIKGSKKEGEQIVTHYCSNCHAIKPLISLGAPRIKQEKDWEPRLKKGAKSLLQHTAEGFNAMPARGGCFECSDEQLLLAIEVLLPPKLLKRFLFEIKEKHF